MESQRVKPVLSAIFIDYDNIYLSLKRKSAVAARQFARAPGIWLREIERGQLISSSPDVAGGVADRRIVLNRSYGNPVPRRNSGDNGPDKDAFPFVRHHFLRAGCEIVDCPPLTAQLKNSSDIRMVMDIRDLLTHETHFDEFIILSGDSDFTPVLHRLRAHARRTVVYVNDHTAMPYTAIADGEIRESDLIELLEDSVSDHETDDPVETAASIDPEARQQQQDAIIAEVIAMIQNSNNPVPIEALADRAQRKLGRAMTADANWAGFGNFRAFLTACLPIEYRLTTEAPFLAYEAERMDPSEPAPQPDTVARNAPQVERAELQPASAPQIPAVPEPAQPAAAAPASSMDLQQVIGRIQEACQAPPLSPAEYAAVFDMIAREITENGLNGNQTLANIGGRAAAGRVNIHPTDVRFVLDVISEPDPWFEQGASASLFASRFRDFVVARCRTQGMSLSRDELGLIDVWFAGGATAPQQPPAPPQGDPWHDSGTTLPPLEQTPQVPAAAQQPAADGHRTSANAEFAAPPVDPGILGDLSDMDVGQLPRIVRSRMRT